MNLMHRFRGSPSYPCYGTGDDSHHQEEYRWVLHINPDEVPVQEKSVQKKSARAEQDHC